VDKEGCPYCGADHVDGQCDSCADWYCDECLVEGLCPNCDGRAEQDFQPPALGLEDE
jgi:hypothetical protein